MQKPLLYEGKCGNRHNSSAYERTEKHGEGFVTLATG
jgi:hypothetical protein